MPLGQPVEGAGGGGAVAAATTAVGTDDAKLEPSALVACTLKRSVLPTSAEVSRYDAAWAPLMFAQLPPFLPQRVQK